MDKERSIDTSSLRARSVALRSVREQFHAWGYLEMPTPVMVNSPAMEEHLHPVSAGTGKYLRTSPEFGLKRVVSAGLPRVYEIGPCFRDEEKGPWHQTEFTMIEWYRVGGHITNMMDEVEQLLQTVATALNVEPPKRWERVTVSDLFKSICDIDLTTATANDLAPNRNLSWDDSFFVRWLDEIEASLPAAVHVRDWPASQAALAQIRTDRIWPTAVRFESYVNGIELANCFFELNNADIQRQRFAESNQRRVHANLAEHPVDQAFIKAVGKLPSTVGIAMGLDRVMAAVTGADSILPFRVP